jgi:adenine/guanine phosphoribosyltransferase-like PRPP-binding protein
MAGNFEYWQNFTQAPDPLPGAWQDSYAATMRDGSALLLPLRDYGDTAIAGLIVNQAAFAVVDTLVDWIAADVQHLGAEIIVGLPTLGHTLGAGVARVLGHANWVAPGTTRKLWYDAALSVATRSVTSPGEGRTMWLDPRLVHRLSGRRVLVVDDVISTGSSARAGIGLLARAGITPVAFAVAMSQGDEWRKTWHADIPLIAAFQTPIFKRVGDGWAPLPRTVPPC